MNIEKVLYNIQRFQILQTKLNPQTSMQIPDDYAYAWSVNMYPLLEDTSIHEEFENQFNISKKEVDIITDYADKNWLDKKYFSFYQYEDMFVRGQNPPIKSERFHLIAIFRYMFLRDAFDQKFWDVLLENGNCPTEAFSVIRKFDFNQLYLI